MLILQTQYTRLEKAGDLFASTLREFFFNQLEQFFSDGLVLAKVDARGVVADREFSVAHFVGRAAFLDDAEFLAKSDELALGLMPSL